MNKEKKACHFCAENIGEIDYKETAVLSKFIGSYKKILPQKKTNVCSWHQKKLATAVKQARAMALMPFIRK